MENKFRFIKKSTEKNSSSENQTVFYIQTGKANFNQQLLNKKYSDTDNLNKFSRPFSYDDNGGNYRGL